MINQKLSNRIDRIKSSKDAKTLMTNFISLSILQIVSYIFPLLTLPYLSKIIGVGKFGELAFTSSIIWYFQVFVDYGFDYTATRDIARCKNDKNRISDIFSNVIWSKFLLLLVSFVIIMLLIFVIPNLYHMRVIFLFTFMSVVGNAFYPVWLFQGLERMKYMTILSTLSRGMFTLFIFIFIQKESDYIYRPLLISLGIFCGTIVSIYIVIFKWKIKLYIPSFYSLSMTIRNSTNVFLSRMSENLYDAFSVMLLGGIHGSVASGIFDSGFKLSSASQQFLGVLSRTFFPYLSRKIEKHRLLSIYYILISIIVNSLLFIFSPWLMNLFYSPEFYMGVVVLKITSISGVFMTISFMYGSNYMIIMGYERDFRNITFVSSFIALILGIILIYYYSFIGAAITITFARILLGVGYYIKVRKIKNKMKNKLI